MAVHPFAEVPVDPVVAALPKADLHLHQERAPRNRPGQAHLGEVADAELSRRRWRQGAARLSGCAGYETAPPVRWQRWQRPNASSQCPSI